MSGVYPHPPHPSPSDAAARAPARRKYLTVLFSDLTGSTRLAGAMEAEDYAQLLDRVRAAYLDIIPRFGGTVVQISGDGLLAMFGYPEANENDGRTAALAALELHRQVRLVDDGSGGRPLRLHTGIHSGLVLLHEGDAVRGRFELLGGATNIASRLAGTARADEILVSEATLGPDQGMFQTGERHFLTLDGKEKPIAVINVLGPAPVDTRFAGRERKGLKPFVGRRGELLRLNAAVVRAEAGTSSFVALVGPPGIGKTRLASELLRQSSGLRIYHGECDAHLGAEPLQPFLQILRSVLGLTRPLPGDHQADAVEAALRALGASLEPHVPGLLQLLAPADDTGAGRRPVATSIAAALKALLVRLAEDGPLALFIDDWQWADDASQRLLESLRELTAVPMLVLLTMRADSCEEGFDDFERLVLEPFSDDEAESAIRQVLPNADPFLIGDMCAAAGGNPLFIEELCHSVAYGEQDFRTHDGSGWLDILIESRFARLPDDQANLLAVAAVIGNIIPAWLLEQVTGCAEDDPLLRALAVEDFIFPGERPGTLRFKHGITRDVIYDSVGLRERRALHLRIAEAFRDHGAITGEEEFYEALAYHYGAGGDAAATASYAELAAGKAMERSALDRAQVHYRAALDALDRLPRTDDVARRWQRMARRLGLASSFAPSARHIPIFEKAIERALEGGDRLALALAEYWLAYIHYGLGRAREAESHCQRAMEVAVTLKDERLKSLIGLLQGQAQARAGDYRSALPLLEKGIASLRGSLDGPNAAAGFAFALACQAQVLADLGRFAEARRHFEEALAVVEGADSPVEASILSIYVLACLWQGRMEEALKVATEAQRVSARVRAFYLLMRNRAAAAYARWAMEGREEDVADLLEATAWLEQCGNEQNMSSVYGWLAEMLAAGGRKEAARHHAARTLHCARKGDRLGEAMALRAAARAAAGQGEFERAGHYLRLAMRAALARGARHEIPVNHLCAAEVDLARGERETALAWLEKAETGIAEIEMSWYAAQAAKVRAAAR